MNSGCTDSIACNYNPEATSDDESCVYINNLCDVCVNGLVIDNDEDNDGVCDFDEIAGCMDESACNYNPLATDPPINIGAETLYIYTDSNFVQTTCLNQLIQWIDLKIQIVMVFVIFLRIVGCTDYLCL